ncbi:MAG: zinc-binding dehydrogenase [Chloroflexi bacterium]|nr:zinc-binding dehydrogenase [Chloroflexota bacterium]
MVLKGRTAIGEGPKSKFWIEELPVPEVQPGSILIKNTGAAVCGSDLHGWRGDQDGPAVRRKRIPGHEFTGRVHSLGKGVTTDSLRRPLKEGEKVVFPFLFPCMRCYHCLRDQLHVCQYRFRNNILYKFEDYPYCDGGFADYFYLRPGHFVFKAPEEIPDKVLATVNCSMAQVVFGVHLAQPRQGDTFVIQGAGGLGIYATASAAEAGASQVIVIDGQPSRLELARKCGATATIDLNEFNTPQARIDRVCELTGGIGADIGIEVVGIAAAALEGIEMVRMGGTYVDIGNISGGSYTLPGNKVINRQLRWIGLQHYNPWIIEACLQMLMRTRNKYPLWDLVSHTFPLEHINEAFDTAEWVGKQKGSAATRVVVTV